uniref:DUF4817 domain-containing protein n=1 Tax=Acrobeloides nanus TaxID=290746 RepID=A0A914CY95_9BILA
MFTPAQRANAIIWFVECGDVHAVQNLFDKKYCHHDPNLQVPSKEEIHKWYENFRETGFTQDENVDELQHKTPKLDELI